MISARNATKESQTGTVEMRENSEEGLRLLVAYFYGKEVNVDGVACDIVVELFKTAHKYNLDELARGAKNALLAKGANWFGANELLDLYFHVRNLDEFKDLYGRLLRVMFR